MRHPGGLRLAIVVDDDDDERARCADLLGELGYEVEGVCDGTAAMARLAREPRPELIVLDVVLPATNGFAVQRALRDDPRVRDVPVVFATATPEVSRSFQRALYGAPVLRKPLSLEALRGVLERAARPTG